MAPNDSLPSHLPYSRRFGGIARLYGAAALSRFQAAHVCVAGLGGVGSWAVEALARSGIGTLTLIDLDNVAESNVNRQLHALSDDFGKPKVTALAERVAQINPVCVVHAVEDFVDANNLTALFEPRFDFVVDAIDQVRVKAAMAAYFVHQRQPFVVSGAAGGQKDAALIKTADLSRVTHDPMLANLRYTLRRRHGFARTGNTKMGVPCVYSDENITAPNHGDAGPADTAPQGLSCAGYGAAVVVTASFGLRCAQICLEQLCSAG